ncbi:acyltransferase [Chitinibacter sp. S2-10]|uniref:acyltransferase n=1 Tax=Chitinibacter sp. S2-10 TaxID=3373597 RepID=UPI0039779BC1
MNGSVLFLRSLSCYLVVLVHVIAIGFNKTSGFEWVVINFFDSAARCAVPVFLMISGFLWGGRKNDLYFIFNRFKKFFIVGLFWVPFYGFFGELTWLDGFSYHLWYFYFLFVLISCAPLLFFLGESFGFFRSSLFLGAISYALFFFFPDERIIFLGVDFYVIPFYFTYFMIGAYFFRSGFGFLSYRMSAFLAIISFLCIFLLTWFFSWRAGHPVEFFYRYHSPFVFLYSVCLFRCFVELHPLPNGRVTQLVAECSLGVYLVHYFVLTVIRGFSILPLASIFEFFSTMLMSVVIIWLMRKNYFLKALT